MPRIHDSKGLSHGLFALLLLIAGPLLIACGDEATGPAPNPDAQLVLLEPKGGEAYHVGDSLHVRWKAQGKGLEEISSVTVSLSPDSGKSWISLKNGSIGTGDERWGDLRWKIPATLTANGADFELAGRTRILIRVQDYQNPSDETKRVVTPEPLSIGL